MARLRAHQIASAATGVADKPEDRQRA